MREGMSLQTRRELLQHMLPQYRGASTVKKKSKLLDAFTAATGYNRKYAMGLLNHAQVEQSTPQRPRPRRYGPEVQHALFLAWHAANRICSKQLMAFLPTLIEALDSQQPRFVQRRLSTVTTWESSSCATTMCATLPRLSRRLSSFSRVPMKRGPRWPSGIARPSKGGWDENDRPRGVKADVGPKGIFPPGDGFG
jgi:hypothetical protein